jgi:hypothetical protein
VSADENKTMADQPIARAIIVSAFMLALAHLF